MNSRESKSAELKILESLDVGILRLNKSLKILWYNQSAERLLQIDGLSSSEGFSYYAHQHGFDTFEEDAKKVLKDQKPLSRELVSEDLRYLSMNIQALEEDPELIISITDISREKKRELQLEASELMFKSFMSVSPILAWIKNEDYQYTFTNRAYQNFLGLEESEFIGKNDFDFFTDDQAMDYRSGDQRVLMFAKNIVRKSSIKGESSARTYLVYKFPFMDIYRSRHIGGLAIDISDLEEAEAALLKLNSDLEIKIAERTEELRNANLDLESYNYSVSHDLRAPIRSIQSYASLLLEEPQLGEMESVSEMLGNIVRNAERMAELVDGLLLFSKLGSTAINAVEFSVDEMIERTFGNLTSGRELKTKLDNRGCGSLVADPILFERVVENLLSNAIKYSSLNEKPLIVTGREGDALFVRDNGIGFSMDQAEKIFGVFERAKSGESYEGTGIGLAIVNRIVKKHGGKVWATSEPGKGATFFVKI